VCTFSFKGKHAKKGFKSAEEHDFRKALFKEAHAVIKAHNNENHTFKLAHNKHSILVSLFPKYVYLLNAVYNDIMPIKDGRGESSASWQNSGFEQS